MLLFFLPTSSFLAICRHYYWVFFPFTQYFFKFISVPHQNPKDFLISRAPSSFFSNIRANKRRSADGRTWSKEKKKTRRKREQTNEKNKTKRTPQSKSAKKKRKANRKVCLLSCRTDATGDQGQYLYSAMIAALSHRQWEPIRIFRHFCFPTGPPRLVAAADCSQWDAGLPASSFKPLPLLRPAPSPSSPSYATLFFHIYVYIPRHFFFRPTTIAYLVLVALFLLPFWIFFV